MAYKSPMDRCPRCKGSMQEGYPALSRADNTTEICTQCGILEAMFNFQYPYKPLRPVNQPVVPEEL